MGLLWEGSGRALAAVETSRAVKPARPGLAGLPAQPEESEEFQEASGPRREPFEYLGHPSKKQMNIYLFVWWGSLGFGRVFFFSFFLIAVKQFELRC